MARKIQFRRGTAASWTSTDPTLAIGELGLETDTGKIKIGDGVTAWSARPYIDAAALAHIADTSAAHAAASIASTPAGTLAATDVQAALNELDTEKAPLASPALTGTPTAPTAATATNTTQVATTAFVRANRAEQAAADISQYASLPVLPAKLLAKVAAGTAVKVSVMGDSIYQGSTATTPGTDDAISLFCSHLSTNWGVTVTKSNQAQGGRTVWQETVEKWATLLSDNADVYVIAMTGKNDNAYETGIQPRTGQSTASSLSQLEALIRELMVKRPGADIIIASGNPNGYASTAANTAQKAYSDGLARIAHAYRLPYADGWNAIPRAAGYPNAADAAYLTDGVHPNSAGHALLAAELTALCPTSYAASDGIANTFLRSDLPGAGTVLPIYHTLGGVITATTSSTTAAADRIITPSTTGTWSAGTTAPWTSSTANAAAWIMAKCTDLYVDLKAGASQGVVDLILDGTVVANDLDLSGYQDGKWFAIGQNMLPGLHHAEVRVVSGSVELQGWGHAHAPCEFIPITSSRITLSGMGASSNLSQYYAVVSQQSAVSGTITVPFVGTGILIEGYTGDNVNPGYYFSSITVDGAAISPTPTWAPVDNDAASSRAITGLTGLDYGFHTVVITFQATGFSTGGFSVIDERPTERPDSCEGYAKVGETITFAKKFSEAPVVTVTSTTANTASATTVTATSALITGTGSDVVRWRAVGRRAVA